MVLEWVALVHVMLKPLSLEPCKRFFQKKTLIVDTYSISFGQ